MKIIDQGIPGKRKTSFCYAVFSQQSTRPCSSFLDTPPWFRFTNQGGGKKAAYQKLNYIHSNPLAEHWQLVSDRYSYKYSSAKFYEMGEKDYTFLKNLREEF